MTYKLKFAHRFQKDFAKLDRETQSRIFVLLERMTKDPFYGAKKLKNTKVGIYRIRVGDHRIRFDIEKKSILLYCLRHRKDVYKDKI